MENDYLRVGKASDLKSSRDRVVFRLLEMLPGVLSWLSLILVVFLSWKKPVWISIFIIVFVIYWLFRTIYLSFLLNSGYQKMKEGEEIDWLEKLKEIKNSNIKNIYHLIIFPIYKEPEEIIKESFQALIGSDYPKNKMIVVLACEERARKEIEDTAKFIDEKFGNLFFKFLVTWHPADLDGEIAGKSSNESWAARKAKELIIDPLKIPSENIIYSSLDADTCVFPKYFSCITYYYLTSKNPTRTSFQPTPLFVNNIWQAPSISRIFSFFFNFLAYHEPGETGKAGYFLFPLDEL